MRREKKPAPPLQKANHNAIAMLGLSLLAVIPYLNTLRNSFVYDDRLLVVENPYVHSLRYLGNIFGGTEWMFQGAQGVTNYYRPLTIFAYLVVYKFFGPNPLGFHLLSVATHMGVVLLVFAVTQRLFNNHFLSLVAAGLFALHPIHTESVAWIGDFTDLELTFFFLLTFLLYLRLPEASGRVWRQAAMSASYLCALISKEPALMLPLLAVTYEHFYRAGHEGTTLRVKIGRYAPLCLLAVAYVGFRIFYLGAFVPSVSRPDLSWPWIFLSAVALTGGYLWKLVWPAHLSVFYVFHVSQHLWDPAVLAGIAGLMLCLIAFLWLWRRAHMVSFAFLWMGITLGPVMNARWLTGGVFAERYLYLPSVGFCWLVGWAAATIWGLETLKTPAVGNSVRRRALLAVLGIVALCCGIATARRNLDWRTEKTLYEQTLSEEPDAQLIRTNLGLVYWENGDAISAEREWVRAMGPDQPYVNTLDNLGLLRTLQENYPEAIALFQRAIKERPTYASAHKNLAAAYADTNQLADADREFRMAVGLEPLSTQTRNAYGHFLVDQQRDSEAGEQFRASIAADDNVDAEESLGEILSRAGETQQAQASFSAALTLDPSDSSAHVGLAVLDERQGRLAEAAHEYHAALDADPQNAAALAALRRLTPGSGSP